MNIGLIREATQLWAAPSPDSVPSELAQSLELANSARDQMLAGRISVDDYLEIVEAIGVSMDDFEAICSDNFRLIL